MKVHTSARFDKSYAKAPLRIQRLVDKQIRFLLDNIRHPSLHTKKYDESRDIWQARVDGSWRLYFQIKTDTYFLINVMNHPK